ncbi:hypothetical protein BS50DRAFT_264847, partial [Corynespora cassiicola Philippines]
NLAAVVSIVIQLAIVQYALLLFSHSTYTLQRVSIYLSCTMTHALSLEIARALFQWLNNESTAEPPSTSSPPPTAQHYVRSPELRIYDTMPEVERNSRPVSRDSSSSHRSSCSVSSTRDPEQQQQQQQQRRRRRAEGENATTPLLGLKGWFVE